MRAAGKTAVVDHTCTFEDRCKGKGTYRLRAVCLNCGTEVIVVLTRGHERPSYGGPDCPICGCTKWSWKT